MSLGARRAAAPRRHDLQALGASAVTFGLGAPSLRVRDLCSHKPYTRPPCLHLHLQLLCRSVWRFRISSLLSKGPTP